MNNPNPQVDQENVPLPSTAEASTSFQFPVDIPPETRSWYLGLIPKPQVTYVTMQKSHTDYPGTTATTDIVLFTLPAYCELISAFMYVDLAFDGTATATVSVGPTGSPTTLLTAQSIKTTGFKTARGTDFTANRAIYSMTTGTDIVARVTTGASNGVTPVGRMRFFFAYINHTNA